MVCLSMKEKIKSLSGEIAWINRAIVYLVERLSTIGFE